MTGVIFVSVICLFTHIRQQIRASKNRDYAVFLLITLNFKIYIVFHI